MFSSGLTHCVEMVGDAMATKNLAREVAKSSGKKRYDSDIPCPQGHVGERYVSNFGCVTCNISQSKSRAVANPAARRAAYQKWRAKNPEKAEEATRRWRANNKDKYNQYQVEYRNREGYTERQRVTNMERRHREPERTREREKRWRQANPERTQAYAAYRRARKLHATIAKYRKEVDKVFHCKPEGLSVDHIVPLVHRFVCGLHVPWNLQYLTPNENSAKGNRFDPDDLLQGTLAFQSASSDSTGDICASSRA